MQIEWYPLLARARDLLFTCKDYEKTVSEIARLAAEVCDGWCSVDVVDEDGKIVRAAVSHKDPTKKHLVEEIRRRYPASPHVKRGIYAAIATGQTFFIPEKSIESWRDRADDDEHYRLMSELGSKSYICLPLRNGMEIVGAIMLISVSRTFTESDVALAQKLAQYFALAVDCAQMLRRMNTAIQLRDDFISIAAHELRTPLTPLSMQSEFVAEILKDEPISDKAREKISTFLGITHKQIQRLNKLVNELLDASRINSSQLRLHFVQTDLLSLIKAVANDLSELASHAGCDFQFDALESVSGYWDSAKLEQVVFNLLSNSVKFAPGKPIKICLRTPSSGWVEFSVTDLGPGIAKADQKLIFICYERGAQRQDPKLNEASTEGLGLGLFISKKIVEGHGGTIFVDSEIGKGSTFRVRLPIRSDRRA